MDTKFSINDSPKVYNRSMMCCLYYTIQPFIYKYAKAKAYISFLSCILLPAVIIKAFSPPPLLSLLMTCKGLNLFGSLEMPASQKAGPVFTK